MKAVRVSEKSRLTRRLQFLLLLYQNEPHPKQSLPSFLTNDPSAHPSAFTNSTHFFPIISSQPLSLPRCKVATPSSPSLHPWEWVKTRARTQEEDKEVAAEGKVSISEETNKVTPRWWPTVNEFSIRNSQQIPAKRLHGDTRMHAGEEKMLLRKRRQEERKTNTYEGTWRIRAASPGGISVRAMIQTFTVPPTLTGT